MSFYANGGSFAMPTITGSQSITGLGFQPKLIILFGTLQTADGIANNAAFGLGMGVSATDRRCTWYFAPNNLAPAPGQTSQIDVSQRDDCVYVQSASGVVTAKADLTSMDADGFTLNWSAVTGTASIVNWCALGGSDLQVQGGTLTSPLATGITSVTGLPFQPTCVLAFSSTFTSTLPFTGQADFGGGLAVVNGTHAGSPANFLWENVDQNNISPTNSFGIRRTGLARVDQSTAPTRSAGAILQKFNTDGFDVNWTNITSGGIDQTKVFYVALTGVSVNLNFVIHTAATGLTQPITGLGFAPQFCLMYGADNIFLSDASINAEMSLGFGLPSGTKGSVAFWDSGGVFLNSQPSSARSNLNRSQSWEYLHTDDNVNYTPQNGCSVQSFDSDGFTLSWENTNQSVVHVLSIGPAVVPGTPWIF